MNHELTPQEKATIFREILEQATPKELSEFEQMLHYELPKSDKYGVDAQTLENVRRATKGQKRVHQHAAEHDYNLGTDGPMGVTPGFTKQTPISCGLHKHPSWNAPFETAHGHAHSKYVPIDPETDEVEAVADYVPYEPKTRKVPRLKA